MNFKISLIILNLICTLLLVFNFDSVGLVMAIILTIINSFALPGFLDSKFKTNIDSNKNLSSLIGLGFMMFFGYFYYGIYVGITSFSLGQIIFFALFPLFYIITIFILSEGLSSLLKNISTNQIIIVLLLIIIIGGGYFLSQDRQSNTEIRYIPKIINQYVPLFNFSPFTGGSSGTNYKAPGDLMIEKGVEMLTPNKPKTNGINPGFTKVCIKDGIGGQTSVTVGSTDLCPLGYRKR